MPEMDAQEQTRRQQQAQQVYEESLDYLTEDDVAAAAESGQRKLGALERAIPAPLRAIWSELRLLVGLLGDYRAGKYRQIPYRSIAAAAGAVLYLVSPMDIIPDFLPMFGLTDDAAVLALCLRLVARDLADYRKWKAAAQAGAQVKPAQPTR